MLTEIRQNEFQFAIPVFDIEKSDIDDFFKNSRASMKIFTTVFTVVNPEVIFLNTWLVNLANSNVNL